MKITLCLSIKFWPQMLEVQKQLEALGHTVLTPPHEIADGNGRMIPVQEYYRIRKEQNPAVWVWDAKEKAIKDHFSKVAESDAILVLNYDKNEVANYIGANTMLEMGLAFWLGKPIYLLNPVPEVNYKEEILGMKPIVINQNFSLLNSPTKEKAAATMKAAQELLKQFAQRNHWPDLPNVDKFDHLHEELIEMSRHLRYKNEAERIEYVKNNKEIFIDGIGDLFFGTCRLANQLGVDIEDAFNLVRKEIFAKYNHQNPENKIIRK